MKIKNMNNNFVKLFLLIFSCDLIAGRDIVGPNGENIFVFDDGTAMSKETMYKYNEAIRIQKPTKELVFNDKTDKLEKKTCKGKFDYLDELKPSQNEDEIFDKGSADEHKKQKSFFDYSIEEFLTNAKYPLIVGGAALSIYTYLILKLRNAKIYVNKTTTWASFNKNVPIESLYEIPQDKFLADLEVVIYRTFVQDENNPNYADSEPLYLFVKAAEKEIKRLEKFVNLYWYCNLPIISFLFQNYDDELILAQEKIERLVYMQELVTKKLCELHS